MNIERYCRENNITMIPKCLNVGDYMLENGTIAVDTKKDLGELANDLYRDKLAFNKKYKKCYQDNVKLVVLVEEEIKSLSQLVSWKSNHTKINGRFLIDMITDLKVSYGIKFCFCDKKHTGENLMKILNNEV